MWRLTAFVRDAFLGETVNVFRTNHKGERFIPQSVAYFCIDCGDIWARLIVHDTKTIWQVKTLPCEQCGIGRVDWSLSDLMQAALPQQLLAREFLLAHSEPQFYFDTPHALRRFMTQAETSNALAYALIDSLTI